MTGMNFMTPPRATATGHFGPRGALRGNRPGSNVGVPYSPASYNVRTQGVYSNRIPFNPITPGESPVGVVRFRSPNASPYDPIPTFVAPVLKKCCGFCDRPKVHLVCSNPKCDRGELDKVVSRIRRTCPNAAHRKIINTMDLERCPICKEPDTVKELGAFSFDVLYEDDGGTRFVRHEFEIVQKAPVPTLPPLKRMETASTQTSDPPDEPDEEMPLELEVKRENGVTTGVGGVTAGISGVAFSAATVGGMTHGMTAGIGRLASSAGRFGGMTAGTSGVASSAARFGGMTAGINGGTSSAARVGGMNAGGVVTAGINGGTSSAARVGGVTTGFSGVTARVGGMTTGVSGGTARVGGLTTGASGVTARAGGLTTGVGGGTVRVGLVTGGVDGVDGVTTRVDGVTAVIGGVGFIPPYLKGPDTFADVKQGNLRVDENCICYRKVKYLFCEQCGFYSTDLRKRLVCPVHPNKTFEKDLSGCAQNPKCLFTSLKEFPTKR